MTQFIKCSRGDCDSGADYFFVSRTDNFHLRACKEHVDVFYDAIDKISTRSWELGSQPKNKYERKVLKGNWREVSRDEYTVVLVLAE